MLIEQLADGGKMIVPVGTRQEQQLQLIRKTGDDVTVTPRDLCRFVPLVGEQGWEP
jgi:protein-L-isoaspartate(D-aspartate) O-methyltransferase